MTADDREAARAALSSMPMMNAVLALALGSVGGSILDMRSDLDRLDRMEDDLNILGMIGGGSRKTRIPSTPPQTSVSYVFTPEPVSKRRARRLKGKRA